MWKFLAVLTLLPVAAPAAEMSRIEKDAGYCAESSETYCFEWRINSLGDLYFIANGDEDSIEYAFYAREESGYLKLLDILPVLEDPSRPGQLFWGYPWDIADIKLTPAGERVAFLGTFDHQLSTVDEDGARVRLSNRPAILFVGRTTQPEASVASLRIEPIAPSQLVPVAN